MITVCCCFVVSLRGFEAECDPQALICGRFCTRRGFRGSLGKLTMSLHYCRTGRRASLLSRSKRQRRNRCV